MCVNYFSMKPGKKKLVELKREIVKFTVTIGDFSIPLSLIERSYRHKISNDIFELTSTINPQDIIDIYKIIHQTTAEYTLNSSSHGTFTKIDHILGH